MSGSLRIRCGWCPNGALIKRESILRHVRGVHLKYPRSKKKAA
ncbi:hypothetical protein ID866_8294 [Astraeus odoratus]|nr:hypothetical protein ID866_8294 [Astraeus odoratus]